MNILTDSELFSPEELAKIEAHYGATYVCETCLKGPHGWVNEPVAIFWNKDPANVPKGGSRWFGLFFRLDHTDSEAPATLFVVNAISAVENDIQGVVAKNGDVIYSRYRHDYRTSPDKSVWIDGGRDYTRSGLPMGEWDAFVTLRIVEGKLCVV